jgi:hypothetical protein
MSIALHPGITIDGAVGRTYGIQFTTDLSDINSWLSSGTSKPATCGHFKTSQSEAGDSYQFSGLIQGLVAGSEINEPEPRSEP